MTKPDTPFPKHWFYYMVLEIWGHRCGGARHLYTIFRLI